MNVDFGWGRLLGIRLRRRARRRGVLHDGQLRLCGSGPSRELSLSGYSEGHSSKSISVTLGDKNMVTFDLPGAVVGRGPHWVHTGTVYGNSKVSWTRRLNR
jgi:hypothetical protein